MKAKKPSNPASLMAQMRWSKTTKDERIAHAHKMVDARKAKAESQTGKDALANAARTAKVSPERRREIAYAAAMARWAGCACGICIRNWKAESQTGKDVIVGDNRE